jgi:hypothetical protein
VHLVEILLPLNDNDGHPFAPEKFESVRETLTRAFGGLTSFTRAPAEGLNKNKGKTERDDIIVLEIMTEHLDRKWWEAYRKTLEKEFSQDEIVIRASTIERL